MSLLSSVFVLLGSPRMFVVLGLCGCCLVNYIKPWVIMMLSWLKSLVSPFEDRCHRHSHFCLIDCAPHLSFLVMVLVSVVSWVFIPMGVL